jgi:hypothetical protein
MPLMSLWQSNAAAVGEFTIEQVVATAGDGNLKDGSVCSQEIQDYFAQVSSEKLAKYIEQCLSSKFDKGGIVLQDLVNELGRRLDYKVRNGRYQGTPNSIGYDGIWMAPEGGTIITEVKTSDAYRISLDTIASYRQKLLSAGTVFGEPSILIVVGRQDTGELEAQVRGSRHAWDVRLISAEALIKLVTLKENSDDVETGRKIRSVLTPLEFTRLDRLVDVMFTAVTDAAPAATELQIGDGTEATLAIANTAAQPTLAMRSSSNGAGIWEFTDAVLLQQKRDEIIEAVSLYLGSPLIKKTRALYWTADHTKRVVCTISKRYTKRPSLPYWYAYHVQWDDFLGGSEKGYFVLGCMDLEIAFAIPHKVVHDALPDLHTTEAERGTYWHIHVVQDGAGQFELFLPKRQSNISISAYSLQLPSLRREG